MEILFTSSGLHALENMISGPARQADRLEPIFQVIATRMMKHEEELFETSASSVGRPWKVLDKNTIKRKRKQGQPFPERPLSGTLNLMKSLTVRGHPDLILEITDSFIRYGTKVPYAQFHDDPGDDQRRPIMFTVGDASDYWRTVQSYIFRNELPNA